MAIVNQLPQLNGKDTIITFVGSGWKQASGGNEWGIANSTYQDNEYWERSGSAIVAKKSFKALIVLVQGVARDGSASNYRTLYNTSEDILRTPTGGFSQNHIIYKFEAGETVKGWQQLGTNNLLSVTYTVILAI